MPKEALHVENSDFVASDPVRELAPRFQFCKDISVVSWSAAALFGATTGNHERQRARRAVFDGLIQDFDIVFVQEAHGTDEDLVNLKKINAQHLFWGTF